MPRHLFLNCLGLLTWAWMCWYSPVCHAAPSTQSLHAMWEELMGNQMIQSYYCVGLVGDLYRAKVYNTAKTQRIVLVLSNLIHRQKKFVQAIRIGRDSNQKALYRHIHSTLDMLRLALQSLQKNLAQESASTLEQFLQYRNAAAQDLQKLLQHRGLKRRRFYQGGYARAIQYLNHHLGLDVIYGYLTLGLIADGYFQLVLNPTQTEEYLGTNLRLIQSGQQSLSYLQSSLRSSDAASLQQIRSGLQALFNQGTVLGQFLKTRQRSLLLRYQQMRQQAWQRVQLLSGS